MIISRKAFQGVIYMSLFFSWLLFVPYYGPGQYLLTAIPEASNVFALAHIVGFLHCGWVFSRRKDNRLARLVQKTAVFLIPTSMLLAFFSESFIVELSVFLLMGYVSAWVVIHWACWFSLPEHAYRRGLMMGMTIALANVLLFSYTNLLYFGKYSSLVILLCLTLSTAGAFLITTLPMLGSVESHSRESGFKMRQALPPWHLLVFAVFAFSSGGALYAALYSIELDLSSQLRSLTILAYIISAMLFGYLADRYSRIILLPSLFTLMGIGFVLLIINNGLPIVHLILKSSILFALACADLYYWLSLADHGRRENVPWIFAVGLSFHLVVISLTGIATERFLLDHSFWFSPVGVIGAITMFLGILFSFLIYRLYYSNVGDESYEAIGNGKTSAMMTQELGNKRVHTEYLDNLFDELLIVRFKLTQREKELTLLLLQGYSYSQIAENLFISTHTVKYHIRNILRKTDVKNRHELSSVIWDQVPE